MDPRQLIETYHKAWTTGDFITARRCLADNLDFKGSTDSYKKTDDFINALQGFKGMLRGMGILRSHFDHSDGALLYACDTATSAGVIPRAVQIKRMDELHAEPSRESRVRVRGATGMIAVRDGRDRWQCVPGLPIKAGGAGPSIPATRRRTVEADTDQ